MACRINAFLLLAVMFVGAKCSMHNSDTTPPLIDGMEPISAPATPSEQLNAPTAYTSRHRAVPIEANAVIAPELQHHLKFIDTMVRIIDEQRFTCPSVSAARPLPAINGYALVCGGFLYEYTITKGGDGHWHAHAD